MSKGFGGVNRFYADFIIVCAMKAPGRLWTGDFHGWRKINRFLIDFIVVKT
ncbi:hypothetical protein Cabys_2801 [Caldithrix abyssi DSM 13497]|uniref:Uncharacterized protein n=1 Tax=Caldithrix abyssi DSM 13497 TaxID=880073 RepID=A0A1J1CA33_CALAY|nr:hypothetical protein Cabys_2801 [Caldithrix abyssi DSM 13497]